jgi:hypothetical protein
MIVADNGIYIGKGTSPISLLLKYANRHGLIAGATGTGKTLTLQGLAEGFSLAGVPVFIADIKGDLAGLSQAGTDKKPLVARAEEIGFSLDYQAFPAIFWDIFGEQGHPVRTTISEMGPLLLSQLLQLNDVQEGVLNVVFAAADSEGLLLLDLDDLRAMLVHVSENAAAYSAKFGNVGTTSVAAIQRALLTFEQQGGKKLFGEPALEIANFMKIAPNGCGAVNILAADRLMGSPRLYAMFMLWLLSELFEDLPEVGDLDKPKLVFFFDEAHLLFNDAPKTLLEKIEQLVRLIRSKGVGVYFITQNPADIPVDVLGQLSNRVQHALRAFTPQDQKGVRAAAQTFRANPAFKTEDAITELGVGEALVSVLDAKGTPTIVERALIRPPISGIGAITPEQRKTAIEQSPFAGVYDTAVNRESAAEILSGRINGENNAPPEKSVPALTSGSIWRTVAATVVTAAASSAGRAAVSSAIRSATRKPATRGRKPDSISTAVAKSAMRSAGGTLGREIMRGLMGALLK